MYVLTVSSGEEYYYEDNELAYAKDDLNTYGGVLKEEKTEVIKNKTCASVKNY